jgi:hypothetical protein
VTDYTTPPPPPPMGQPPLQPAGGKDNSQLIGIIGIVTGLLCCFLLGVGLGVWSLMEAKKKGGNPMWGYLAIGAGVLNLIGGTIYQLSR